jgi:hypothetical protein
MLYCRGAIVVLCALALGLGLARSQDQPSPAKLPNVTGAWTGLWGPYNPAHSATLAKEKCKALDCRVVQKDRVWQATFEGECGRPYKFIIKMKGRQVGDVVLSRGRPIWARRTAAFSIGSGGRPTSSSSGSTRASITRACSNCLDRSSGCHGLLRGSSATPIRRLQ